MLESQPDYVSKHKFELPAENLLPPQPKDARAHLEQISQQLFALCYNVERFIHRPHKQHIADLDPAVWNFLHEVIDFLPRTLDPKDIDEARVDIYQALYLTEQNKPFKVTELVNPGASAPDPLTIEGKKHTFLPMEVEFAHDSNPFSENQFTLAQSAIVETDGVEYVVEFIPDDVPEASDFDLSEAQFLALQQQRTAPRQVAAPPQEVVEPPQQTSSKPSPSEQKGKGKKKAAKQTTKPSVTSRAAKSEVKAKTAAKASVAKARARSPSTSPSPSPPEAPPRVAVRMSCPVPDPAPKRRRAAPAPAPAASTSAEASGGTRKKRGRVADDAADEPPAQKRVRRVAPKESKKVVAPPVASGSKPQVNAPVAGTRRSTRNKS